MTCYNDIHRNFWCNSVCSFGFKFKLGLRVPQQAEAVYFLNLNWSCMKFEVLFSENQKICLK